EVEVADAIHHARPEDNNPAREAHRKGGDRKKNDKHREPRGPSNLFSTYTPLNASREHILTECHASEFRQGGIKFPKQVPPKPHQDT
ncbi:hypothetical protein A2U01_0085118, partial [Trifolium medium]|nr:hypothetical protein [Trifolium medium]